MLVLLDVMVITKETQMKWKKKRWYTNNTSTPVRNHQLFIVEQNIVAKNDSLMVLWFCLCSFQIFDHFNVCHSRYN